MPVNHRPGEFSVHRIASRIEFVACAFSDKNHPTRMCLAFWLVFEGQRLLESERPYIGDEIHALLQA